MVPEAARGNRLTAGPKGRSACCTWAYLRTFRYDRSPTIPCDHRPPARPPAPRPLFSRRTSFDVASVAAVGGDGPPDHPPQSRPALPAKGKRDGGPHAGSGVCAASGRVAAFVGERLPETPTLRAGPGGKVPLTDAPLRCGRAGSHAYDLARRVSSGRWLARARGNSYYRDVVGTARRCFRGFAMTTAARARNPAMSSAGVRGSELTYSF
jgi:hypothetical protein